MRRQMMIISAVFSIAVLCILRMAYIALLHEEELAIYTKIESSAIRIEINELKAELVSLKAEIEMLRETIHTREIDVGRELYAISRKVGITAKDWAEVE